MRSCCVENLAEEQAEEGREEAEVWAGNRKGQTFSRQSSAQFFCPLRASSHLPLPIQDEGGEETLRTYAPNVDETQCRSEEVTVCLRLRNWKWAGAKEKTKQSHTAEEQVASRKIELWCANQ